MSNLLISEIFFSLNGEGLEMGKPTIFVRLSGCNLDCSWCDTKYADHNATEKNIDEILEEIEKCNSDINSVLITGGEPLTQDIEPLVDALHRKQYDVGIETNGSVYKDVLLKTDFISVDIKTPSSNNETNDLVVFMKIANAIKKRNGQMKAVIADRRDYDFLKKFIQENSFNVPLIIQPCWGKLSYKELCEMYLNNPINHNNVRVLLQIHKLGEIK